MFFHLFIGMECVDIVFFSVNAARSSLNGVCRRKFHGKGIKLATFPWWCSGKVLSRQAEGVGFQSYSMPFFFSFFLSFFSVFVLFCLLLRFVVVYKYTPKLTVNE